MSNILVEKSVCGNKWVSKKHNIQEINYMISNFGLSAVTASALLNKIGNFDEDKIRNYLNIDMQKWLSKVWELKDINFALDRITQAIDQKEKICILGDYDVDGMLSSIMLRDFFNINVLEVEIVIPNRLTERYGPTEKSFDFAKKFGAKLCITVDCGTVAFDEIDYANELGLEVIVFDHHLSDEKQVNALAVVNPNQKGDESNLNELCASGLLFFIIWALSQKLNLDWDYDYVDLASVGTICDVMNLVDYNRDLVKVGIEKIKTGKCYHALLDLLGVSDLDIDELNTQNISFGIGPRINAAARMGQNDKIIDLFTSKCSVMRNNLVTQINDLNNQRKEIEKKITKMALVQNKEEDKFCLVIGQGWHDGVLGIVAGRLVSATKKPSMVINIKDDIGKGSGRSVKGFNIALSVKKALEKDLLLCSGGHELAVGCSIKADKVEEFANFMQEEMKNITFDIPEIVIDSVIDPIACNSRLWNEIQCIEPCGQANGNLLFMFPAVKIINFQKFDNYMSCIICGSSGSKIKGVMFPHSASDELIFGIVKASEQTLKVSCIGNFSMSKWKGKLYSSFMIKDISFV